MFNSEAYYRRAAGEGASYIGLLLVVYDTLAGDLRRAGEAAAGGRIAERCDATSHALLLLGHLESWAESLDDATLRSSLAQFYSYVRAQSVALQVRSTADGFDELAKLVEETRAAWQQKEAMHASERNAAGSLRGVTPEPMSEAENGVRMSWSA